MQLGFMPGKGTMGAILIIRQLQEQYRAKRKNFYFGFVDLEKAFDRVPRELTRWALRKLRVEEWLVSVVMGMYNEAGTVVRTPYENSDSFNVGVGVHVGFVLSSLLFVIVMEVVTRKFTYWVNMGVTVCR